MVHEATFFTTNYIYSNFFKAFPIKVKKEGNKYTTEKRGYGYCEFDVQTENL